jgi:choline-sulfatase
MRLAEDIITSFYSRLRSIAPLVAVRDGDLNFIHRPVDPPQLFDLASDPDGMQNLLDYPIYAALRQGHYFPWDYQPLQLASKRYMRNHIDLNILEDTKRFPRGE